MCQIIVRNNGFADGPTLQSKILKTPYFEKLGEIQEYKKICPQDM